MAIIEVEDCRTAADVVRVLRLSPVRRKALSTPKPRPQLTVVVEEPPAPALPAVEPPPAIVEQLQAVIEQLPPPKVDEPVIPSTARQEILRAVAREFGVTVRDMLGPRRITTLVRPRHIAMYFMREILEFTYPHIGRVFKRDHTVPVLACRKCAKELDNNTELAHRIVALDDLIRARLNKPKGTMFRIVGHRRANTYLKLGWLPTSALEGTHHGEYSVLMKWICPSCPPIEPMVTLKGGKCHYCGQQRGGG